MSGSGTGTPATSGSGLLVSAVVQLAMRKIGELGVGQTTSTLRLTEGLTNLQMMLRSWAANGINLFASVNESVSLVAGTASYTWGTGGTITTTRPHQVLRAFIRDSSNTDHPLNLISEEAYRNISVKSTSSRPSALFFYPTYPLATISLYPTPDAVETLHIDSYKPFTETSSFATTADTLALPPQYEEAVVNNLAIRLAPEYGKSISPEVAAVADTSYSRLISLNAINKLSPARLLIPAGYSSQTLYSINSDSYN